MAQIVTITNPLTGQPAQVDQLEHTAQEIDDAIARALPGGDIDIALQKKVNTNILDNWYWGNPVNQRGQTVYTSVAGGALVYSIDRYAVYGRNSAGATLSIEDGFIRFNTNDVYQGIRWGIESKSIAGRTVTFSMLLKVNGNISFEVRNNGYNGAVAYSIQLACTSDKWNLITVPFTVPADSTTLNFAVLSPNNISFDALAVKLELGDQQTLAHQDENGNWVLNEIPDYGEQLRRCQRYFQRLECSAKCNAYSSSYGMLFHVPLQVPMRTKDIAFSKVNPSLPIQLLKDFNISWSGDINLSISRGIGNSLVQVCIKLSDTSLYTKDIFLLCAPENDNQYSRIDLIADL